MLWKRETSTGGVIRNICRGLGLRKQMVISLQQLSVNISFICHTQTDDFNQSHTKTSKSSWTKKSPTGNFMVELSYAFRSDL